MTARPSPGSGTSPTLSSYRIMDLLFPRLPQGSVLPLKNCGPVRGVKESETHRRGCSLSATEDIRKVRQKVRRSLRLYGWALANRLVGTDRFKPRPGKKRKKKFQAIMIDRARARGFCAGSMIFHDLTDSRERPEISQTRPMRQFPET